MQYSQESICVGVSFWLQHQVFSGKNWKIFKNTCVCRNTILRLINTLFSSNFNSRTMNYNLFLTKCVLSFLHYSFTHLILKRFCLFIYIYIYIYIYIFPYINNNNNIILSVDGFDGSRNIRAFIFNLFVLFVWLWYYNLNKMNLFGLSFILYIFKLSYGSNF